MTRPFPRAILCFAGLAALLFPGARADIKLPSVLAEHMVVQRDLPVHLWGTALPGEKVRAEFRGNSREIVADKLGLWSIYLPGGAAGGPFPMTLAANNAISFSDILVGDVWVASGQSNMEMPMGINPPWKDGVVNYKEEIAAANYPMMRLFHVEMQHSDYLEHDAKAIGWTATTPEAVNGFSAVGYYFGREIHQTQKVPIGIMEADVGASPAEAWTSLEMLTSSGNMEAFQNWTRVSDGEYVRALRREDAKRKLSADPTNDALVKQSEEVRPQIFYAPGELFNGMINFMTPFPIKGVIWYQGTSNGNTPERAVAYRQVMADLIQDWRTRWAVGDFPFYYVQLNSHRGENDTPGIRESQRRNLSIANTGMAVTIDVGDPTVYHPSQKAPIGHRLALIARALTYGEKLEYSGPLFVSAHPEGNEMIATFTHAAGLTAKGGAVTGFDVAGENGVFAPANARIDGERVIASSPKTPNPVYVRYAYSADPSACSLANGEGLPASPFTSKP